MRRVVHLGLRGNVDLPYETVFHRRSHPGDAAGGTAGGGSDAYAALEVRAPDEPGLAPEGHRAVTVTAHRTAVPHDTETSEIETSDTETSDTETSDAADLLDVLADRGLDLRDRVVARIDQEAPSYGPAWRGAVRGRGLPVARTPVHGLYAVGGTVHPGPGMPAVLLGAAAVAQEIGPA